MAVENYFTNNASNVGEKVAPGLNAQELIAMEKTLEIAAADDDGSTYLLFKDVPASFVPVELSIYCDTITAGTDYDIGLYNSETGVVVDKDLLMDGQTLATALTRATGHQVGLAAVNIANSGKSLAELLGLTPTTAKSRYDIVLTGNTVGSAAGTVTAHLKGFAA